ncbi:MAG: FliA/WhiG family RNA polymerase sigma factor [Acidobacteriota bacterium]
MLPYSSPTTYQKPTSFGANAYSEEARDALIMAHLPKVKFIADRIATKLPPSVERDDLYGAGVVGLIDAVERYDASRGVAFTTFAEMRVRGAILDNLRSLDWASRTMRRRAREVQNASTQFEQDNGRTATELEVAEQMNISITELRRIKQEMRGLRVGNLDERDEETGLSMSDSVSDTAISQLDRFEEDELRHRLAASVGRLPERERQVIALYYLEELTMKEIGEVLGVTESRVSQLRTQATTRLKADLKNSQ